jgi:exodeoxyribonuclease V alpha subunit
MVKAFGDKMFDVIEAEPHRLREVTGIGPMRARRITGAWAEQKIVREIMVCLHSHGVGTAHAAVPTPRRWHGPFIPRRAGGMPGPAV